MSPIIVTYPTWQELFGERPSEDDLLGEIRKLDRLHTVWLLARINIFLALDRFQSNPQRTAELQTFLINLLVDEKLFAKLKERFGKERLVDRQTFHSLQVLALMKRVMQVGAEAGGLRPDAEAQASYKLGRCLLMANDLLLSPEGTRAIRKDRPSQTLRKVALQLQLGSGGEINNPPDISRSMVRSEMIFGDILREAPEFSDVSDDFQKRTGIGLQDYVDHVFAILAHYLTLDPKRLIEETGLACIKPQSFFAKAPRGPVEAFWRLELTTLADLKKSLKEPSPLKPHHDFILYRRRPFVVVAEENAVPIHLSFVQEKLESGLFWAVFNSLETDRERDRFFVVWGQLFERYVSRVISRCFAGSAEMHFPFPKFSDNNEEAFDGVISAGKYLIVMEYKGGFLAAQAKYAEDEQEFMRDLERKFGTKKGAGIEQLVRKIVALFCLAPQRRRTLAGIDTTNIEIVIPMLVVQEPFVSSEFTSSILIEFFGELKNKERLDPRIHCTFPLIVDVADVEALQPYLSQRKISLADCAMARVQLGAGGLLPFRDFVGQYLQDRKIQPLRDVETAERFRAIMNRSSERFFGKPLDDTPEPLTSGVNRLGSSSS